MKTKIKRHSRSVLAVILTLCMLVSCMTVGLIATDAARVTGESVGGNDWQGNSFFRVPDSWDLETYPYVQAWAVQSNFASSGTKYAFCLGNMSIVGTTSNSRLYFLDMNTTDHGSWASEYLAFTANTSNWGTGDFYISTCGQYTAPLNFNPQNSSGSYLFTPSDDTNNTAANNNTMSGSYNGTKRDVLKKAQDFYVTTDGSASAVGGSLKVDAYYENGEYYSGSSAIATSSITVNTSDSGAHEQYEGTVEGTKVTLTATANSGYTFAGFYDASTGGNLISATSPATYYVYGTKSVYARFTNSSGDASTFSLTGNIDSTYIASINGVANTLARGSSSDVDWWKAYHSEAAINTAESGTNVYSITFTTVDAATLATNGHSKIDIGLSIKGNTQKAFQIGGTNYNYIGGDYKVTSAGVTNQNIVDVAATNGGGSLIIQPGRTYKLTVDETNKQFSIECTSGDKYFLAGQYSDGTPYFFGTVWTTSNNELTETSSGSRVYEKTFTSDIPAGTINFKVVKNGDSDGWDGGSWPSGGNQSYVINANATSVKFSFSTSTEKTTVTQENSSSSGDGTWPPTDTAVTNVTGSSTTTSKYLVVASNDDFNNSTAIALEKQYSDSSNNFYWADLTDYLSYNNIHMVLSSSTSASNRIGSHHKVNDSAFAQGSKDSIEIKSGSTTLFRAKESERSSAYRAEVYDKDSSLNHFGVLIRTNKNNESGNWTEYAFYYTDYVAPVVETKVVDIYAKDACLRDDNFNRFSKLADTEIDQNYFEYSETNASTGAVTTYTSIADYNTAHPDAKIVYTTLPNSHGSSGNGSSYVKMTNVPVGAKIKLKTTLSSSSADGSFNSTAFKDTHYLKAYSFNGMTYQLHTKDESSDGVYEEIWTVRAVNTQYYKDVSGTPTLTNAMLDGKAVEVTPIYYMKDNKNCKTFYIDGYDGEVQNAWGNMLCVYPYYEGKSNKENAFGGYPGQPMLLWGGKYQMEIPLTVDGTASGATVKGLTLHNGFWDLEHRALDLRCNARNHAQTYDYDDFYKLYKEKNPDTIIFDFKYKTANDNFGDGYDYFNYEFAGTSGNEPTKDAAHYAASGKNGVEIVTDYFGRQVDVFGNLLTDAQKSDYDASHPQDKELLIVSTGYKDTYVGEYATLWAVYAPKSDIPSGSNDTAGKFIGLISSSELYLNTWDNASKYPVSDHGLQMTDSRFENTYKHLKDYYTGVPALISYEKEIWNDSKDKANRSDGKWYYSNTTDKISASIKIQYGSYTLLDEPDHSVSSDAWNDDPFDTTKTGVGGEKNIGTNTGCSAYFTNTNPNLMGKVASGEQFADSKKSFTFQAVPSGSYMFAGWVRYSNGKYYEITENEIGESPMSANDVYIARFVNAQVGTLTIQHVVEQTATYTGTGTPAVTVTVKNGGGTTVETFNNSTVGEKLDISKWIDSHYAAYTIDISLTTTPTNESYMKEIVSSSGNFAATPASWTGTSQTSDTNATVTRFTVQEILDSGVTSLRYVSHLQKPTYTYKYEITYTYNSRFWGEQSYTVTGTFANDSEFSANTTGSKDTAKLNTDFIINKTPYEKTFRQKIDWNYTDSAVTAAAGNTANHGASAMTNNAATAVSGATNTYKMTAHVYASNTVNDRVTAEFVLPYKYDTKANGYAALQGDMYQTAEQEHNVNLEHTYIYDTSYESFKLTTQAYKLFTYDDAIHSGSDGTLASSLPLIEAAPYVIKDSNYHYYYTTKERYFSSSDDDVAGAQSFMIGNNKYWLNTVPDGQSGTALTSASTATFNGQTYNYAILIDHGTPSVYDDELYRFVNVGQDNVQYTYTSWVRTIDGIVKDGSGSKLFFTRWDIYNTKGDLVASCYNRRFNYSGYDNYVVKPVYETAPDASGNNPNTYASSTGDGYKSQITFLDDSRNQWNNGASGDYNSVTHLNDANYAGDKIFTDFAITYAYEGRNINTVSSDEAKIRVGMVIEKLDALDTVGSTTITDASYYANKYKGDTDWTALSNALAGGTSLTSAVRTAGGASSAGHSCFNSKIAANYEEAGYTQFGNSAPGAISGQESVVDNFNRLQWFYTFNNSTKTTAEADTVEGTMKNYAFRAISYIIVEKNDATTATLTDTPVYFTIYDTATRAHN